MNRNQHNQRDFGDPRGQRGRPSGQGGHNQPRDDRGHFTSYDDSHGRSGSFRGERSSRGGYGRHEGDDHNDRGTYGGVRQGSRSHSSDHDTSDHDRFGGDEGRSRGGRHSAESQRRDEYGHFAGYARDDAHRRGYDRHDDDDRAHGQHRGGYGSTNAGRRGQASGSYHEDDYDRHRDERGRFMSNQDWDARDGGRYGASEDIGSRSAGMGGRDSWGPELYGDGGRESRRDAERDAHRETASGRTGRRGSVNSPESYDDDEWQASRSGRSDDNRGYNEGFEQGDRDRDGRGRFTGGESYGRSDADANQREFGQRDFGSTQWSQGDYGRTGYQSPGSSGYASGRGNLHNEYNLTHGNQRHDTRSWHNNPYDRSHGSGYRGPGGRGRR